MVSSRSTSNPKRRDQSPPRPGHFAHHDWLESSVEALDQALGNRRSSFNTVPPTPNPRNQHLYPVSLLSLA